MTSRDERVSNVQTEQEEELTALQLKTQNSLEKIQALFLERKQATLFLRLALELEELPPLHAAVEMDYKEIIEAILEFDLCDVNSKDHRGRTALHIACKNGNYAIVQTLLKYGSDINIMSYGITLFESVNMGKRELINRRHWDTHELDLVYDLLEQHVLKLEIAHLYVSPQNYLHITYQVPHAHECKLHQQRNLESEVDQMKHEMIGDSNVSFHDILKKDENWLAKFVRNKDNLQHSDHYKTKYPWYANMINNQFRKGKWRNELLESGYKMFPSLFKHLPELPVECAEEVQSYLSNEQLRVFNGCSSQW